MGWKKKGKFAAFAVLFICNILVLASCGKKLVSPESYTLDADSVSSITAVLGEERELSEVTEEKAKEEEEEKTVKKIYTYLAADTIEDDLQAYITFLTAIRGFVSVAPIEAEANVESYIDTSAQEGMVFQIDIKRTEEGYMLAIHKREGEMPKPIEEEKLKAEENDSNGFSRNDALQKLEELSPEDLRLPYPIASYVITYDEGRSIINDRECYGIHAYLKREDKRMENMGIYYVACDGTAVYHYSAETDTFANIGPILPPKPLDEPEEERPKVDPDPGSVTAKILNYSPEAEKKEEEEKKHRDLDPGIITADVLNQIKEEAAETNDGVNTKDKNSTDGKGNTAAKGNTAIKENTEATGAKGNSMPSAGKPIAVKKPEIAPGDLTAEDLNR